MDKQRLCLAGHYTPILDKVKEATIEIQLFELLLKFLRLMDCFSLKMK